MIMVCGCRSRLAVAFASSALLASAASSPVSAGAGAASAATSFGPSAAAIAGALLLLATVDLVCLAGQRPQPPARRILALASPATAARREAYGALVAALVLAVDSAASAITIPLLPSFSQPATLYFARPVVGAALFAVLPLALRPDARCGAVVTAAGLVALATSCLMYASSSSFWLALGARLLGAVGSSAAVTGVFCSMILRTPSEHAGWRSCLAVFGAALGCALGPFAGRALHDFCGQQNTMVILAFAVAGACWLQLSEARISSETSRPEASEKGCVLKAARATLLDDRRRAMLVGLALSSAVLALHATLTPLTLEQAAGAWLGSGGTMLPQATAGFVFALAALAAGAAADATGEQWAAGGAVVALVLNILGLRCLDWAANGRATASTPAAVLALLGLGVSHVGLGAYVGLALPMFLRRTRVLADLDAKMRLGKVQSGVASAPSTAAAGVAAAFLGAAFMLGDALGAGAQFVLVPLVGPRLTTCAFALCLAAHAVVLLTVPGWVRGKGALRWRAAPVARKASAPMRLTEQEWKAAAAMMHN